MIKSRLFLLSALGVMATIAPASQAGCPCSSQRAYPAVHHQGNFVYRPATAYGTSTHGVVICL
ncbi:MAG: hypothetical protein SFV81_08545 [Pirellulaceae bacterium]|nr:hypothetical protein [Pirellulaceae bacterium]